MGRSAEASGALVGVAAASEKKLTVGSLGDRRSSLATLKMLISNTSRSNLDKADKPPTPTEAKFVFVSRDM